MNKKEFLQLVLVSATSSFTMSLLINLFGVLVAVLILGTLVVTTACVLGYFFYATR